MTSVGIDTGWKRTAVLMAGSGCSLLGLMVLVGWFSSLSILTQIASSLPRMQPTTALSFVFCGAGFIAISTARQYLAAAAGLFVAAIGALIVTQYLLQTDWDIDRSLMRAVVNSSSMRTGRMAPTTALCFVMSGLALLLMSRPSRPRHRGLFLSASALMMIALALAILVGYATGTIDPHMWGQYLQMAVHTALGFLLFGSATVAFAWHDEPVNSWGTPIRLPIFVGIALLTVTLFVGHALRA
jgi:hypothetical protein